MIRTSFITIPGAKRNWNLEGITTLVILPHYTAGVPLQNVHGIGGVVRLAGENAAQEKSPGTMNGKLHAAIDARTWARIEPNW